MVPCWIGGFLRLPTKMGSPSVGAVFPTEWLLSDTPAPIAEPLSLMNTRRVNASDTEALRALPEVREHADEGVDLTVQFT